MVKKTGELRRRKARVTLRHGVSIHRQLAYLFGIVVTCIKDWYCSVSLRLVPV